MNLHARLMTAEDFLSWCQTQEERFELVNGQPVLMAGASRRHDRIVVNLLVALHQALRGKPCQPSTADVAIRTAANSYRRPDVTVDCAPSADERMESAEPTVVCEVLSPSTRGTDLVRKTDEYRALASVRHIVLIEQDQMRAIVLSRQMRDGWTTHEAKGPEGVLPLEAIDVQLALTALYDGVELQIESP